MKVLSSIYRWIVKIEEGLSKLLLITIIILCFVMALARYMNFTVTWSLDLVLLLFAWFAFLACSQSTRRKANLGVDILTRHFSRKVQECIDLFNRVLMLVFIAAMTGYGVYMAQLNWKTKITTLNISNSYITLSLVLGGILISISLLIQIVQDVLVICGRASMEDFTERRDAS